MAEMDSRTFTNTWKTNKMVPREKNLAVGDTVLVTAPSTPQGTMPLGRV